MREFILSIFYMDIFDLHIFFSDLQPNHLN